MGDPIAEVKDKGAGNPVTAKCTKRNPVLKRSYDYRVARCRIATPITLVRFQFVTLCFGNVSISTAIYRIDCEFLT